MPHSSIDTNQQNTKVSCVEELCEDYFTDTSKNTKVSFRCCYAPYSCVGLLPLTPTSKITKVPFRCYALHSYMRTTSIDSKRTKASSRCRYALHSYVRTTSLTPVKTRRLYLDPLRAAYLCGTTSNDTIKNTKVSFRCFTRHIVMWDYFH